MSSAFNIYGNAPEGEYNAVLCQAGSVVYHGRGGRFLVGFMILDDRHAPLLDECDDYVYAVAVCNEVKRDNPKSKPMKIRRALIPALDFDPIRNHQVVPTWDELLEPNRSGNPSVCQVRVVVRGTGKRTSLVTHIKRPGGDRWTCIEGKFEGGPKDDAQLQREASPSDSSRCQLVSSLSGGKPTLSTVEAERPAKPLPRWLKPSGELIELDNGELINLPSVERDVYRSWKRHPALNNPWYDEDGNFVPLASEVIDALDHEGLVQYEKARLKKMISEA